MHRESLHAAQLLRDVPLIREWCESVLASVAYRTSSVVTPSHGGDPYQNPTLDAVITLEEDAEYQYARRFLRYVDGLAPSVRSAVIEYARGRREFEVVRLDKVERVIREIGELFPIHPFDRLS